jgi:hypothetical protein
MVRRNGRRPRIPAIGVVTAGIVAATSICTTALGNEKAHDSSKPGMSYGSLAQLPDFSGWWYGPQLDTSRLGPSGAFTAVLMQNAALKPLLTAQAAAALEPYDELVRRTTENLSALLDPADFGLKADYCGPQFFAGNNGGFHEDVEFLFTPGRVTITNESGLIRRIDLDQALPAEVDETSTGTSVGRWDEGTLVVETVGLDRDNQFLGPAYVSPLKIGRDARIIERFSLKDPDTLQISLRITAPELLVKPLEYVALYHRDRGHVFHEVTQCAKHDRSIDPNTGKQRFDTTPPEDLPPPP